MKTRIVTFALVVLFASVVATTAYAAKSDKKQQRKEDRAATATSTTVTPDVPYMGSSTPTISTTTATSTTAMTLPFSKQTVLYVLYGLSLVIAVILIVGLFTTMGVLLLSIMGAALAVTVVLILIATFTTVLY